MNILKTFTLVLALLMFAAVAHAQAPVGAAISDTNNSRAPTDSPGTHEAGAGNTTQMSVSGQSITQSWQGYYGNVSGDIILADSSDNQLYNWSLANPEGEIYAANQTVTWTNIQCFNFTATGSLDNTTDNPGDNSLNGTNLTQLESYFNIGAGDVDGVDETFFLTGGAGQHDTFITGTQNFAEGECISTQVYNETGNESNQFEEVLLYDPAGQVPVYASLLENNSVDGFNGEEIDFEMLVLEDGHSGNVATTTYYFYVELE